MPVELPSPNGSDNILVTGIPLRMSKTKLETEHSFPAVGEHNEEIYTELLGYSREDLVRLQRKGVV